MSRFRLANAFPLPFPILSEEEVDTFPTYTYAIEVGTYLPALLNYYWKVRGWKMDIDLRASWTTIDGGTETANWKETVSGTRHNGLPDEINLLNPQYGQDCLIFTYTQSTPGNRGGYLQHQITAYVLAYSDQSDRGPLVWSQDLDGEPQYFMIANVQASFDGTGGSATLEPGEPGNFTVQMRFNSVANNGHIVPSEDSFYSEFYGSIVFTPELYYEYRGADGQPIYDAATGAALIDPLTAPVP